MSEKLQRNLASFEQEQGFFRYLTALCTSALLLIVTFLEKFFKLPEWKPLIAVTLISFLLSIIACVIAYFLSVILVEIDHPDLEPKKRPWAIGTAVLSVGGFLIGLVSLITFALKNFY